MRRHPIAIIVLVVLWELAGALTATLSTMQSAAADGVTLELGAVLYKTLVSYGVWTLIILALFWLIDLRPIEPGKVAQRIALYLVVVLAIVVFRAAFIHLVNPWVPFYKELPPFGTLLLTSLYGNFFMAWLLIGVGHAIVYATRSYERDQRNAELRAHLEEARLKALTAQINPHFLFNALNSIAELVHHDPQATDRMLVGLGALLRESLATGDGRTRLDREIELLEHYLAIEQQRLRERLIVHREIDPAALACEVPSLLLQPLAENAIRYAIAPRAHPGNLWIRIRRRDDSLVLSVEDDGDPPVAPAAHGTGIGLDNTRARLACLYGDRARLEISERPGGGRRATIHLPAGTPGQLLRERATAPGGARNAQV